MQIKREGVNVLLLSENLILYREKPKDSTKRLLELISEFIMLGQKTYKK